MEITITEYAKMHGKAPVSVRQKALRGGFKTARRVGRDWVIDSEEPYTDRRAKGNEDGGRESKAVIIPDGWQARYNEEQISEISAMLKTAYESGKRDGQDGR